jgi:Fe-S cluster biogenesis protein NfuA/nitrite reductase/ring-hydroxylating ferredoxin subunit
MAQRVEALLAGFDSVSTPRQARENADELARTIVSLYGAGLERVLSIVYDTLGERSDDVFAALCADRFVESLLCLHGLHPLAVEERVAAALEAVRPYLKSHEGGIELTRVEDGVAYLRLEGSCDGCPSSLATVKLAVERAILEKVPDVHEVRVEGVTAEAGRPSGSSLRIESDWLAPANIPELAECGVATAELSGTPVLLVRFDETIYAYRNQCPGCGRKFDGNDVRRPFLVCASCERSYDVVRSGRAVDDETSFVEPFPIAHDGDRIRVAIPLGV